MDPEQFPSQDSNILLEQKAPVFPQQYASQAQMAQGSYTAMQDPSFHTMGQRPSYATLRVQPRPGLRPTGLAQTQPNQLRLQLQHRLQAQQVRSWLRLENRGAGQGRGTGKVDMSPGVLLEALKSPSVLSKRVKALPRCLTTSILLSASPPSLLSLSSTNSTPA